MTVPIFLSEFHFLRVEWLLLIVPFIGLLLIHSKREASEQQWLKVLPTHLAKAMRVEQPSWGKQLPKKLLFVIGLAAIFVAAGPSWYRQSSLFGEDNSQLIVVLDVSDTMNQTDVAPSRLIMAKQKILETIEARNSGETALIVYSGSAHVAMPFTQDIAIFKPLLESIKPEIMPRQGKFAEYTVPVIERLLSLSDSATVMLVTDALNQQSITSYTQYFKHRPHRLLTYGIGHPDRPSNFPLQSGKLESLSESVNGDYVQFSPTDNDVGRLERIITQNAKMNMVSSEPWFDSGYSLVWFILVVYLMWFRKGWLVHWGIILCLSSFSFYSPNVTASEWSFVDLWLTKDQQGQYYYQQGEYKLSAELFDNDQWKATAYFQAGEYEIAQQYFMRNDDLHSQLGVAASLTHQKEYLAAKRFYISLLEVYPNSIAAKTNLIIVEKIIKDIEQFTKSQANNNEQQSSRDLGDKPQTSEGLQQEVESKLLIKEVLTAEQILSNASENDKWMRAVQSDLSDFLTSKFYIQFEAGIGISKEFESEH